MIKDTVNRLVKKYGTRDPVRLASELNVILLYVPLKGVNGFYQYYKRNHIIYINQDLDEVTQRITLAHELGHMFLHKKTNAIYLNTKTHLLTAKYEIEADIFASELLIEDDSVINNLHLTIDQLASYLEVEPKHVKYKLENIGGLKC